MPKLNHLLKGEELKESFKFVDIEGISVDVYEKEAKELTWGELLWLYPFVIPTEQKQFNYNAADVINELTKRANSAETPIF